eukprot:CAMPEP_0175163806 /NCGR_PEP_ID=MMETSP0087-20121206/25995_1 /TAXON_ID=136419 /ORGANISM="Unknown Unknown, Strain D1" /LENGTH=114 /DNA_ID=CAMNT_0016452633 /DNA_START=48 /DNA_END=389 /DNA_ORIENTATION=-
MVQALGNERVNWLYEGYVCPEAVTKPSSSSDRACKDDYIRLKYVHRAFLNKAVLSRAKSKEESNLQMHAAVAADDLKQCMQHLAMGYAIEWADPANELKTALHVAAEHNALLCA